MKDVILNCIEKYSEAQLNLGSEVARVTLTNDIAEALTARGKYTEFPEQIHSLNDIQDPLLYVDPEYETKYIYESPDGKTVYRREFGDMDGDTKVRLGFFEHKNQLDLNLVVQPMNLKEAKDFELEYMKERRNAISEE